MEEKVKNYLRNRLREVTEEIKNSNETDLSKKGHLIARDDEIRKALNFITYGS